MRYREAWLLKWNEVDFERQMVNVKSAKKGKPRQLKISQRLIGMLQRLQRKSEMVFGNISYSTMRCNMARQRRRIAAKLQNPRIQRITFHTLRHWKASTEYQRGTRLIEIKEMLGHKSIETTMIYTHLIGEPDTTYVSRVTRSVKGARKLTEQGYEYVKEWPDGLMLFRKLKRS